MSSYNFTVKLQTPVYEIKIDPQAKYGYFEHDELGEDSAGGLWFEDAEMGQLRLADYDGVFQLPREVVAGLRHGGFCVPEDCE